MRQGIGWRLAVTAAVLAFSLLYLLPAMPFMQSIPKDSPLRKILPDSRINLGLDLVGGIHLTLGVDVEKAVENVLNQQGQDIRTIAREQNITVLRPKMLPNNRMEIILAKAEQKKTFEEMFAKYFDQFTIDETRATEESLRYIVSHKPAERENMRAMALRQAVNTIRNRIDQFGVSEPDIREQPADHRIVIQLPGIKDADRAVKLVGQTAHLEFHLVREKDDAATIARGVLPPGAIELPMQSRPGMPEQKMLVDREAVLTGQYIVDARPSFDQRDNSAFVSMKFNSRGAALFERITGENLHKRLAIVLDGKIHSAPVIQAKIAGGNAQITGRFTTQEAQDLALVLRAGSLPAPVTVLEERTFGPSLGKESIDKGIMAATGGGIAVIIFMAIYYSFSGMIANLMLILDMLLIMAGMAFFGATLTLPGIAGIVLTLGMAVDANVLIFERIREELAKGLTPVAAIRAGFSRATVTITDANLTTIIAAVVLYQFGTGPIRGFAVTLTLGIVVSMFTAVFVSHIIYDLWMGKTARRLSI